MLLVTRQGDAGLDHAIVGLLYDVTSNHNDDVFTRMRDIGLHYANIGMPDDVISNHNDDACYQTRGCWTISCYSRTAI